MLNRLLSESLERGDFLDIYREEYSYDTIFSRILAIGENLIAAAVIDDDGSFDGICFMRKADISRIRKGGNEMKAIETLISRRKEELPVWNRPLNDFDLIDVVINYLKNDLLSIHTENLSTEVCFMGKCLAHDDAWIKLDSYGTFQGRDHSELFLRVADITRVDILSKYSQSIETVFADHSR